MFVYQKIWFEIYERRSAEKLSAKICEKQRIVPGEPPVGTLRRRVSAEKRGIKSHANSLNSKFENQEGSKIELQYDCY